MCNQYTVMFVCDLSIVVVVMLRYEHYLFTKYFGRQKAFIIIML